MNSEPETKTADNQALSNDTAHEATVVLRGEELGGIEGRKSPDPSSVAKEAVVIVRGEAVGGHASASAPDSRAQNSKSEDSQSKDQGPKDKEKSAPPALSEKKVKMRVRLPALDDDGDVGMQKDHIVTRDGKPDLAFSGTLLASAAPSAAPKGEWDEYRVYETTAGKHVFSKIKRNVAAEKEDTHEAEVFDPTPTSMPSKLLKSARDLTHTHEKTWADAAAEFFGYDPLAKELYKKLGGQFEEHIS